MAGVGQEEPFSYFPKRQQMFGSLALAMSKVPATNVRGVVHQIDALMMNRSIWLLLYTNFISSKRLSLE